MADRPKRPRRTLTRRQKLLRDALLLPFLLAVLLIVLDFPSLSLELTRQATERRHLFGPGEVILSVPASDLFADGEGRFDRYYVVRWGDWYALEARTPAPGSPGSRGTVGRGGQRPLPASDSPPLRQQSYSPGRARCPGYYLQGPGDHGGGDSLSRRCLQRPGLFSGLCPIDRAGERLLSLPLHIPLCPARRLCALPGLCPPDGTLLYSSPVPDCWESRYGLSLGVTPVPFEELYD